MKLTARLLLMLLALLLSFSCVSCINSKDNGTPTAPATNPPATTKEPTPPLNDPPAEGEGLEIISIEMKEKYGDSTLIKYGDYEVLVDAGDPDDAPQIQKVLRNECTDGILEMLIVTHAHEDHLGAISSISFFEGAGITAVETVVDFGYTYTTKAYDRYVNTRAALIAGGSTYYAITDIIEQEEISDLFYFDDTAVYIEFFDTGNYAAKDKSTSKDLNDTSIAFCLNYENNKLLMTGDLTSKCELDLINNIKKINENYFTEENNVIFKANHHGSDGSNSDEFLKFIKPDYIFISAAILKENRTSSGVQKAQHPYSSALIRMKKYTEQVYWNGINGTTSFHLTKEGSVTMSAEGRTLTYYVIGAIVSAEDEKKVTFFQSRWYTRK